MFPSRQNAISKISSSTETYREWYDKAFEHDKANGLIEWRNEKTSDLFDFAEIINRFNKLRELRQEGDDLGLLFTLNEGIHGNMAGMGNPRLYGKALTGTKQIIVDYVDEIASSLLHISQVDESVISFDDKLDFFNRASHCYGSTALMLSGGGQLGNFHIGVLKALTEEGILPDVISGSSAGSIFAALVGTYTHEELIRFFDPENILEEVNQEDGFVKTIVKKRDSLKIKTVQDSIARVIPNMTFQEAYEKTGKHINISIAPKESHQKSRLLNAIASPNVLIRSAVMASCAVPGIYPAVTLYAKDKDGQEVPYLPTRKWVDGSMSNDLPSKRLTRLYGVNHFIVSLTNPVILPFIGDPLEQNEYVSAFKRFAKSWVKETSQLNYSLAKPFFRFWPKMAAAANGINSIIQQDYLGDINITADFSVVKPRNLLSALTTQELAELINKGEKATWPKIEAIRVTTKISHILHNILKDINSEDLVRSTKAIHSRKRSVQKA